MEISLYLILVGEGSEIWQLLCCNSGVEKLIFKCASWQMLSSLQTFPTRDTLQTFPTRDKMLLEMDGIEMFYLREMAARRSSLESPPGAPRRHLQVVAELDVAGERKGGREGGRVSVGPANHDSFILIHNLGQGRKGGRGSRVELSKVHKFATRTPVILTLGRI